MSQKKVKISVYTRSGEIAPAGYYRVFQYLNKLPVLCKKRLLLTNAQYRFYHRIDKQNRIMINIFRFIIYFLMLIRLLASLIKDLLWKPDVIIISRALIPKFQPFFVSTILEKVVNNKILIWDFDDNILQSQEISHNAFNYLCAHSNHIVVTHSFLKSTIPPVYHKKVLLLPTTDGDMSNYDRVEIVKSRENSFLNEIRLVWVATSSNLIHLERIIPILEETAEYIKGSLNKSLILTVVCNVPLKNKTTFLKIKNVKWTRNIAIQEMINAHIGIMPLIDSNFTRGKGGFKLVQYISIGLPVLASNVGFNADIVTKDCGYLINDKENMSMWKETLIEISKEWNKLQVLSSSAYNQWLEKFAFDNNYKTWKEILGIKD